MRAYSSLLKSSKKHNMYVKALCGFFHQQECPTSTLLSVLLVRCCMVKLESLSCSGPFLLGALLNQCPECIKRPLFDT